MTVHGAGLAPAGEAGPAAAGEAGPAAAGEAVLALRDVRTVYGRAIEALRGLTLEVPAGGVVALLGANGAGKSTALKAITGLLASERGSVVGGEIAFEGESLLGADPVGIVRRGISHSLEGRRVFRHLTVEENLLAGSYTRRTGWREDLAAVYDHFPRLAERRSGRAGYLSGGEQQMLAIGRALMSRPRLLALDEPSLGLAPIAAGEIFELVGRLNAERGMTILVVEQNVRLALSIADRGYVVEQGRVALVGSADELRADAGVRELYLGQRRGG